MKGMRSQARRDEDFRVQFEGMPDGPDFSFRPEPGGRPVMAGTLPARVTSTRENDQYGHIDKHGRYRVRMLFADEQTTFHYARIFRQLREQGSPIPTNDIWIAAMVQQHDLLLFSRAAHFDALPQLGRASIE